MNRDRDEEAEYLATFGYKQELNRSLGRFSAFAAGFSFLSILTGATMLFGFGFGFGGPAFFWAMPVVFLGQFPVALCFAELASKYPLAGGVYQWVKNIAKNPRVAVSLAGREFEATARILDPADDADLWKTTQDLARAKYDWGDGLPVEIHPNADVWHEGYAESFAGTSDEFARPPQGKTDKRDK